MNFCVARILGNELPPRDVKGDKIKVLKHILDNDLEDSYIKKIWILNRIYDSRFLDELKQLLVNKVTFEIPFSFFEYKQCHSFYDKIQYSININNARNFAISKSNNLGYDLTFVFDGDCYLQEDQFLKICSKISSDKEVFGVPTIRSMDPNFVKNESMIAIKRGSSLRFDESIMFGDNDKIEFIKRSNAFILEDCHCTHQSFCRQDTEVNLNLRCFERGRSMKLLVSKLDSFARVL